jgi:hypothetical protein
LVWRLLDHPVGPLAALSKDVITLFKSNFNRDNQLPENATNRAFAILREVSPNGRLEGPHLEVASRWVRSLCPLGIVLGARALD